MTEMLPAWLPTENVLAALTHVQNCSEKYGHDDGCTTPLVCHVIDVLRENGGLDYGQKQGG